MPSTPSCARRSTAATGRRRPRSEVRDDGRGLRRGLRLRPRRGGPAPRGGPAESGLKERPKPERTITAMASQRDVKNKIASVKNIQKITRAMEMVAAARLRRAEQRISALRPDAGRDRSDDTSGGAGGRRRDGAAAAAHRARVAGERGCCWSPATGPRRRLQLADHPRRACASRRRSPRRGSAAAGTHRAPRRLLARVPRARAGAAPTRASPTGPPTQTRARSPTS